MVLIINKLVDCDATPPVIALPNRIGLNKKRVAYILQNISSGGQIITLSTGEPKLSLQSRYLAVGGTEDRTPEQNPPQQEIYAIGSDDGGILAVYEEVEE